MKALTILQPWAELILLGEKRIENRTWPTAYRGKLLIHAGKSRRLMDDVDWIPPVCPEFIAETCFFGGIIAVAELIDCIELEQAADPTRCPESLRWVKDHPYADGPWCWVLENVRELRVPIPAKGALGLWNPTGDVIEQVNHERAVLS